MRIRIKFRKYDVMRFIGHLDIMRYFQKSMRRAGIDIAYSAGFSPHQIMSFAAPLGVGLCSDGEYLDIEANSITTAQDMKNQLNDVMVPGIDIVSLRLLPDQAGNAMASVAAAKYLIEWKDSNHIPESLPEKAAEFMSNKSIIITKQTKKNTLQLDIRPFIYSMEANDSSITLFVNASSSDNVKPVILLDAFYKSFGSVLDPLQIQITRIDTYYNQGTAEMPVFAPLEAAGDEF